MTAEPNFHTQTLWLIGGLFLIRLLFLFISPYNLHGDEAQYWAWSKDLDWGFFTKPPGIAAVIAATTSIFGDAEWAVRLSSPLLHSVTAYVIYRTTRFVFSSAAGFWAAAFYLLMPAVWLSSGIASTDVPLLLCWAVALNGWVHLRNRPSAGRAFQLGMAIGLGILCKYAMLFFLPALIFAVVFDALTRRAVISKYGLLIVLPILAWVTPNMVWNMEHDFATLEHTAANAKMENGASIHPLSLLKFWGSQLAVFGPVSVVLFLGALRAVVKKQIEKPSLFVAAFALSPLIFISFQALLAKANANWAVSAYIAASILTAHFCVTHWPKLRLWTRNSLAIQTMACLALAAVYMMPSAVNALGRANDVKRVRAWPETVSVISGLYEQGHDGNSYRAVATDKRIHFYGLNYYGIGETAPLYMWLLKAKPVNNHAEISHPLPAGSGPVLILNYETESEYIDALKEDFARLEALPPLDIDLGGGKRRTIKLFAGYDYKPTTSRY